MTFWRKSFSFPKRVWLIFLFSFLVKIIVCFSLTNRNDYWQTGYGLYDQIAQHLLYEGEFYLKSGDTLYEADKLYATRVPLYPIFLAWASSFSRHSAVVVMILQSLISTVTVAFVYRITRCIGDELSAIFAAFFYAFYPYSLFHDSQLQETVLYNCLVTVSTYFLLTACIKKKLERFLWTGFLLGAAILTRASHFFHSFFFVSLIIWLFRRKWRQGALFAAGVCLTLGLCLSPWLIRNKLKLGSFVVTTLLGGTLTEAHNEFTFYFFPYKGSIDDSTHLFRWRLKDHLSVSQRQSLEQSRKSELSQNQWFSKLAMNYILTHKFQTLKRGIFKVAVNFVGILSPLRSPLKTWCYFISYWFLTFFAVIGLLKIRQNTYFQIFLTLTLSHSIVSFLFWAHTSHRSFLDPLLAVTSGIGWTYVMLSFIGKAKQITSGDPIPSMNLEKK